MKQKKPIVNWMESRTCAFCGKGFEVLYPHLWRYKRGCRPGMKYFCSWSCLRAYDERKNEKMGAKAIRLTPEQKSEAFRLAIDGGNPLKYLAELGSPSASSLWYTMKKELKLKDPETYEKLPAKYKFAAKPEAPKREAQKTVKRVPAAPVPAVPATVVRVPGGQIEIPECSLRPEAEVPEKQEDDFEMITIRSKKTGNRYEWSQEFDLFSVRAKGDELALSVADWKSLLSEIPAVAGRLGVKL